MKIETMEEDNHQGKLEPVFCTEASCDCELYQSDVDNLRSCRSCGHNVLSHESHSNADVSQKRLALATAALLGVTAVPIQVKILLERLLSPLSPDELVSLLGQVGWTPEDFTKGYAQKDLNGLELSSWSTYQPGEEQLLMQRFLNFTETSHLAAPMLQSHSGVSPFPAGLRMFPNFLSPPAAPHWLSENIRLFLQPRFSVATTTSGVHLPTVLSPIGNKSDRPESNCSAETSEANSSVTQKTEENPVKIDAVDLSQMSSRNEAKVPSRPSYHPYHRQQHPSKGPKVLKLPTVPSGSGKRRVECQQCHKSFCDKGALKIHFSAVHLREMHKCTVAGCTLMFSSRRSRNRHSNNPNPKLHTPAAAGAKKSGNFAPAGRVVSPLEAAQEYERMLNASETQGKAECPLDLSCRHQQAMSESLNGQHNGENGGEEELREEKSEADETLHFEVKEDIDGDVSRRTSENCDTPASSHQHHPKGSSSGSARKRKSVNPTRCVPTSKVPKAECFETAEGEVEESHNRSDCDSLTASNSCATPPMLYSGLSDDSDCQSDCQSIDLSQSAIHKLADMTTKFPELVSRVDYRSALNSTEMDCVKGENSEGLDGRDTPAEKSTRQTKTNLLTGQLRSLPSITMTICKTPNGTVEIPINEENPRMCAACDKLFQNHFSVKTHYQNVHLKLQHSCTVDGCTATFPSKRSRDRHSGNLNLHRKLLSTSSASPNGLSTNGDRISTPPAKEPLEQRQQDLLRNFYAFNAGFPGLIGPFSPPFPPVFSPNQNLSALFAASNGHRLLPYLSPSVNLPGCGLVPPGKNMVKSESSCEQTAKATDKRETVATQ